MWNHRGLYVIHFCVLSSTPRIQDLQVLYFCMNPSPPQKKNKTNLDIPLSYTFTKASIYYTFLCSLQNLYKLPRVPDPPPNQYYNPTIAPTPSTQHTKHSHLKADSLRVASLSNLGNKISIFNPEFFYSITLHLIYNHSNNTKY